MLRYLLLLMMPACLCAQQTVSVPVRTEQRAPIPMLDLTQYGQVMQGMTATWMSRLKSEGSPSTEPLVMARVCAADSPALAALPMARKGTLNVIDELIAITKAKDHATERMRNATPERRPLLTTLSPETWAKEEKEKIRKQWRARLVAAERALQKNLMLINRSIITPGGKNFAMPTTDALMASLRSVRMESSLQLQPARRPGTMADFQCRIVQVMKDGCIVMAQSQQMPPQALFVVGLVSPDLREGQDLPLRLEWDGVYQYTTAQGASSTVESWRMVGLAE